MLRADQNPLTDADQDPLTDADHALMAKATQEALDRLGVTDDESRRAVGIAIIEAFGTGERDLDRLAEAARRRVGG